MWLHLTVAAGDELLDKVETNDDMGALQDLLLQSQRDLLPGGQGVLDWNNLLLLRLTRHHIGQSLLHVLGTFQVRVHGVLGVQLDVAEVAPEGLLLLLRLESLGRRRVVIVLTAKLKVDWKTQLLHLCFDFVV